MLPVICALARIANCRSHLVWTALASSFRGLIVRDTFIGVLTELAPPHPELLFLSGYLGFGVLNEFIA
jgi:hypothetical protein